MSQIFMPEACHRYQGIFHIFMKNFTLCFNSIFCFTFPLELILSDMIISTLCHVTQSTVQPIKRIKFRGQHCDSTFKQWHPVWKLNLILPLSIPKYLHKTPEAPHSIISRKHLSLKRLSVHDRTSKLCVSTF